jgi:hypothetical protein
MSFFCMTTRHLEDVLYLLRVNRHLWNEGTIQKAILDRPQPAPVVVEVKEMQEEVN